MLWSFKRICLTTREYGNRTLTHTTNSIYIQNAHTCIRCADPGGSKVEFATSTVDAFVTTEPKSSNCTLYMVLPPRTKSGSGTSHVRLTLDVPSTTPRKPVGELGTVERKVRKTVFSVWTFWKPKVRSERLYIGICMYIRTIHDILSYIHAKMHILLPLSGHAHQDACALSRH